MYPGVIRHDGSVSAKGWEAEIVPGLGVAFLLEMRERTRHVLDRPHTFPSFGTVEGVRCAHAIGRFPHLIVYVLTHDAVHVLAFMHPRRRPGYWDKRVPKSERHRGRQAVPRPMLRDGDTIIGSLRRWWS